MFALEAFNTIAGVASILSLLLTIFIVWKIQRYARTDQFLKELTQANTTNHHFQNSGLAMKINPNASLIEIHSEIQQNLELVNKTVAMMNKAIDKNDKMSLWEYRHIGLPNYFKKLNLLLLQGEIKSLEFQVTSSTIPDPTILSHIEQKREKFLGLAQRAIYTD